VGLKLVGCYTPWYADFANYLASNIIPHELSFQQKKKFLSDVKHYFWDYPFLYKLCYDNVIRRSVPMFEANDVLHHCYTGVVGGHFGPTRIAAKVL
jgi:hypothetical protein